MTQISLILTLDLGFPQTEKVYKIQNNIMEYKIMEDIQFSIILNYH